jgi:hypothetical protein
MIVAPVYIQKIAGPYCATIPTVAVINRKTNLRPDSWRIILFHLWSFEPALRIGVWFGLAKAAHEIASRDYLVLTQLPTAPRSRFRFPPKQLK